MLPFVLLGSHFPLKLSTFHKKRKKERKEKRKEKGKKSASLLFVKNLPTVWAYR